MDKEIDLVNWGCIPAKVFDIIGKYCTQKHLQKMRLINRYFNNLLIPLCYKSIQVDVSSTNFIKKIPYGTHVQIIKLDARLCDIKSLRKLHQLCPNITKFIVRCNEVEFFKLYVTILSLWSNVECLQFCKTPDNLKEKWSSLKEALQGAKKLKRVDLTYSSGVDFVLSIIDPSQVSSLQLPLNVDTEVGSFLTYLPDFTALTSLDLSAFYCIEDYPNTPSLISPNLFMSLPNLVDLNLEIIVDAAFFPNPQLLEQVQNQKQRLFQSHERTRMNNFKWVIRHSWHFSTSTEYLPIIDNLHWENLTQLNLYSIGPNLMTYIIKCCPNLTSLQMSSTLPLPNVTDEDPLTPLTMLRKLSCGSFSKGAIENSDIIRRLFPHVIYFCMLETSYGLRNIVQDPSTIPSLFPNLQIVWFLSHRVDFKLLLCHPANPLPWTQLAFKYDHFKSDSVGDIDRLLERTPHLQSIIIWDRVFSKITRKNLNLEKFEGNLYKGFYCNRNPFEYQNLIPVD